MAGQDLFEQLKFRDPVRARALAEALRRNRDAIGREVAIMHVCGSHEQAIARFGLRAVLPRELEVIMGPGCPVCITDTPEVDEAVALAAQGAVVCTYGDMLKLPGATKSLGDAQADGGRVEVVYSVAQAEAGDGLLVAAAHVHDVDRVAADRRHLAVERLGERPRARRIAELHLIEEVSHGRGPSPRRSRPSRRRP